MSYSVCDLDECLRIAGRYCGRVTPQRGDISRAVAAWGRDGDFAEWRGGFLFELRDGRFAYICGWCDTSGWG